ncbi:hypothetical protein N7517_000442 [Penicillium concentricum]|uniref:Uncharacterized protein n=1 Tax=Penicillium concentricum TaxID=293559 RepID=A0A9W9SQ01_9EURO|nr:uncharacterized protein N7517_000442 [Penicillium concentricum]KAJ5382531.1 hypothetical protein N7517_000442 [Penicillium concentricum]
MSYTVLPFGATSASQKRENYPLLLSDIVRDCTDAIDSLTLFEELVSSQNHENNAAGFKAFDGHVGETACHIRAGILLEIYSFYQKGPHTEVEHPRKDSQISSYIERLEVTRKNAQTICSKLTSENTCPSRLGFGSKFDAMDKIITSLGWIEPGDHPASNDSEVPEWDVENHHIVIRYLIGMFILGKYRQCCKSPTQSIVIRLQPKDAAAYASRLISAFWDQKNSLYKTTGSNRLDVRFKNLQKWISAISCSWVRIWAARLSFSEVAQRLVDNSIKKSPKGHLVIAAYVGFLVCRRAWAANNWPVLLVDRHFCSEGYHLNAYIATLQGSRTQQDLGHHIIPELHWELTPVTFDELQDATLRNVPMICILGNSIHGPHEEYIARISDGPPEGSSKPPEPPPTHGSCAENTEHQKIFIGMDHDRLSQAILADHRAYPFPLSSPTSGDDDGLYLLDIIRSTLPNDLIDKYFLRSRSEVNNIGGGTKDMGTFRWEHIFAEHPGRLADMLQSGMATGLFA